MPKFARLLAAAGLALFAAPAPAAVVAVSNMTDRPVTFTVGHAGKPAVRFTLALGEARLVPAGRRPEIAYTSAGKPVRYRLEPYHAYMFWAEKAGAVEFHGIDLAGAMPKPDDVPADPPAAAPLRLPVAVLADNANPRTRAAWEKAYRARVAAVSDLLTKQCGVGLTVLSVGEWRSDNGVTDLAEQLKGFEKAAPAVPNTLAVGFTSRLPADPKSADRATGFVRGPLWPYLLVRDGQLRTEPERVEALLREVAHHLGAAHTPDPLSAVRGSLAEGPGPAGPAPVGIDPLNLLAVGIWVEELRAGPVKSFADLKPVSRERLAVIYKTLAGLLPTDPLAADHLASLEKVGEPGAVAAADPPARAAEMPKPADEGPEPAKPAEEAKPNDRTAAARKVVRAVTLKAVDLRRDPDADKARGDALTAELLAAAGDAAMGLDEAVRVPAFLIGIGVALDHSDVLRANPLVGRQVRAVETEAERAERLTALGNPTLRGRRDLCQHFVVSAALTALVGSGPAEAAGLAKELMDRDRASGFSFADLQADLAGIQLAQAAAKHPPLIGRFRDGVSLDDYMPPIAGLKEGLPTAKFVELYGDLNDPRFKEEMDGIRKRVAELPKYKEIAELKGR